MKNNNLKMIMVALAVTVVTTIGATAYAGTSNNTTKLDNKSAVTTKCNGLGFRNVTGKKGFELAKEVLKTKFKISEDDINKSLNSGKNIYTFIKEKGIKEEDFKKALLDAKTKAIDEAVVAGKLTKEQGETLKEKIKKNIDNCKGNENSKGRLNKFKKSKGNKNGTGMKKGNCTGNDCGVNVQ